MHMNFNMKTFEQYNNKEKEMEELFIQLSHLDELDIKFDFLRYKYEMFYFYKKNFLFDIEKFGTNSIDKFWIDEKIWNRIVLRFGFSSIDIEDFMVSMSIKYFGINKKNIIGPVSKGYTSHIEDIM